MSAVARQHHGLPRIDDATVATIEFESGALGTLTTVWHDLLERPNMRRLEILCQQLYVALEGDSDAVLRWRFAGEDEHRLSGVELADAGAAGGEVAGPLVPFGAGHSFNPLTRFLEAAGWRTVSAAVRRGRRRASSGGCHVPLRRPGRDRDRGRPNVTVYVGLLRGVNVGGATKPMADLRRIAEGVGSMTCGRTCRAATWCSVPVVPRQRWRGKLRSAIAAETKLDPPIAVRTAAQLAQVVERCPFDDTANVHVTFLVEGAKGAAPKVDQEQFAPERYEVRGKEVYLYLPNGLGRSKLAAALTKGAAAADGTTRNWRTVNAVLAMARA